MRAVTLNDEAMIRSLRTVLTSDANDMVHWQITCAAWFGQDIQCLKTNETLHRWH